MTTAAFLIAAHEQPELFGRLVERLSHPGHKIIAHVDARADEGAFRAQTPAGDVTYLDGASRVAVTYAGLGLVEATFALMRAALGFEAVDQIFILSGVDYPLAPVDRIVAQASGLDILRVDRELRADRDGWFDRTAFRFHLMQWPVLNPRTGNARAQRLFEKATNVWRRRQPAFQVMHGPAFWSVTRAAAERMLEAERRLNLVRWARYARSQAEFIFQTAYWATDINKALPIPRGAPNKNLHATHYVDFTPEGSHSPRTLDDSDFDAIASSGALFARKMSGSRSAGLMARIDRELL